METLELGLGLAGDGNAASPPWQQVASILGADRLAHWDATALASLTLSGAAVTGWIELVGGGVAAPGAATTRPNYNATGLNNKSAALIFDGIDDYLRRDQAWLPGVAAGEIWAVLRQDHLASTAGDKAIVVVGPTSGSTAARQITRNPVSSVNRAFVYSGNGTTTDSATVTTVDFSGYHVTRAEWTGTQVRLSVDGSTPATAASVPNTATARTVIGANAIISGAYEAMALSALIITNPLSADKATALRTSLQSRY